ncbi:MAG: twin-arginine translocase TatA/TatE family subunit [Pseudomonadota bacterium]
MGLSIWQILIVVLLLVLLFGRGKISELMGDMAKGIKSFKKGMAEDPDEDEKKAAEIPVGDSPIDVTPEQSAKKDSA